MKDIPLKDRTIEFHHGRNVDEMPSLLARYEKGEGFIPSEADIRLLGVRNFKNAPELASNYWDTSTLSATKGQTVKVILPYKTGSRTLTEVARFGLSLINPNEDLILYGINLDVDGRWEKLEGNGVYTLQRKGLILNEDLTESQAMKHKLLLTKLQHPDYVDSEFARSKDEVAEIIGKTFELGKPEHGNYTTMGQHLPRVSDKGILTVWEIYGGGMGSNACNNLGRYDGQFAFDSVYIDKARVQLQSLEGTLKPEQISQIGDALDERDELREKLLTTDKIYSVIGGYVGSANESEIRKILDGLTSQ